jgi:isoleucyl-tRNA synthetase
MEAVRRLASLARAAREERGLRVRQPLARMQVAVPAAARGPALDALLELLRLEVNVKLVEVVASDTELVRLRAKPNYRSLGKRYGKRTPAIAAAAERLSPEQLRGLERGEAATLEVGEEPATFLPEDVVVERDVATDWLVASDGPYVAALDPRLDDILRREGLAREVVNRVQRLRKEAGLEYTSRIALFVDGDAGTLDALRPHAGNIGEETLARRLDFGARAPKPDYEQHVALDDVMLTVGFTRYEQADGRSDPQPVDAA